MKTISIIDTSCITTIEINLWGRGNSLKFSMNFIEKNSPNQWYIFDEMNALMNWRTIELFRWTIHFYLWHVTTISQTNRLTFEFTMKKHFSKSSSQFEMHWKSSHKYSNKSRKAMNHLWFLHSTKYILSSLESKFDWSHSKFQWIGIKLSNHCLDCRDIHFQNFFLSIFSPLKFFMNSQMFFN